MVDLPMTTCRALGTILKLICDPMGLATAASILSYDNRSVEKMTLIIRYTETKV